MLLPALALLSLPLPLPPGDSSEIAAGPGNRVWTVDTSGFGDFTNLQTAINNAADGDTLLIRNSPDRCCTWSYGGFAIDGKSLALIGTAPGPHFVSHGTVRNIPVGGRVVLSNLDFNWEGRGTPPPSTTVLRIAQCDGSVRIQNCRVQGYGRSNNYYGTSAGGVRVVDSGDVSFHGCEIRGGDGGFKYDTQPASEGMKLQGGAEVTLYHTTVTGGEGGTYTYFPFLVGLDGGAGIVVQAGELYLSSSTVTGGMGGAGDHAGAGADGVDVHEGSSARARNTAIHPGPGGLYGGKDGNAVVGELEEVTTGELGLEVASHLPEDVAIPILVTGEPGDTARVVVSNQTLASFVGPTEGYVHAGLPIAGGDLDLGTLPASGSVAIDLGSFPVPPNSGRRPLRPGHADHTGGRPPLHGGLHPRVARRRDLPRLLGPALRRRQRTGRGRRNLLGDSVPAAGRSAGRRRRLPRGRGRDLGRPWDVLRGRTGRRPRAAGSRSSPARGCSAASPATRRRPTSASPGATRRS